MIRLIIVTLLIINIFPQNDINIRYIKNIGSFSEATSFIYFDGFFICDKASNSIIKIDTLGNLLNDFNGFGWDSNSIDFPSDIEIFSRKIFICDFNNHRVLSFDKDLNLIYSFDGAGNNIFSYPRNIKINKKGELIVLDAVNKNLISIPQGKNASVNTSKLNSNYVFKNPLAFTIVDDNFYVLDDSSLLKFDTFGSFINKTVLPFKASNINSNEKLVINTLEDIYIFENNTITRLNPDIRLNDIQEVIIQKPYVYVLTTSDIKVFRLE